MRPLIAERAPRRVATPPITEQPRDPAPSIWSYRAQRLWLTPLFRRVVRVGLPSFVVVFGLGVYFADEQSRIAFAANVQDLRQSIESRPEFRVNAMAISGASEAVENDIRAYLGLSFPLSSFDLDLPAMRSRIEALPAIAQADLRIQAGGYLAVNVRERVPVLIWQTREGSVLIDAEGHFVADLAARTLESPLPLIGGDGADHVVDEALAIHAAAAPLADSLLGLVRIGERRWDVVLQDGRRILLPEQGAVQALDRALGLHDATDILNRDVVRLDLRDAERVSVTLSPAAMEALRQERIRARANPTGEQSG